MTDELGEARLGRVQRFADSAGGPAGMVGTEYQVMVACHEALMLLSSVQSYPITLARLRCESRVLVAEGQLGFDVGVITDDDDRQIEVKTAPVRDEIVELLARLPVLESQGRVTQLVHAKETAWTTALADLVSNAWEAADEAELDQIVGLAGSRRQELYNCIPAQSRPGKLLLLRSMCHPNLLPLKGLKSLLQMQATAIAGDHGGALLLELGELIRQAFQNRRTWEITDLHRVLTEKGLIRLITVVAIPEDSLMVRAIAVLDECVAPLSSEILDGALGVGQGATATALRGHVEAGQVELTGGEFWRVSRSSRIPKPVVGDALVRTLRTLIDAPPPTHKARILQVTNVLALAIACAADHPDVAARAFRPYDKASKATGDFSTVYRLAHTALRAAEVAGSRSGLSPEEQITFLWLRGHARICGTAWTLQRVGQITEAADQMDQARIESTEGHAVDNLAFGDKCQGRLSRLRAEQLIAQGLPSDAVQWFERSRVQLEAAYRQFTALVVQPEYARCDEEPGECLALRARTELSAGDLTAASNYAKRAHDELDYLGPKRKASADVALVDAEIALAVSRLTDETEAARIVLATQRAHLSEVLDQFSGQADSVLALDVAANEIMGRTLQVLGQLAREVGDDSGASDLLKRAATHFERLGQIRVAWRCQAAALDLRGDLPAELAAALAASDASDGCRVEAARLHDADPRPGAPERHWQSLVERGRLNAINLDHPWIDRLTG